MTGQGPVGVSGNDDANRVWVPEHMGSSSTVLFTLHFFQFTHSLGRRPIVSRPNNSVLVLMTEL